MENEISELLISIFPHLYPGQSLYCKKEGRVSDICIYNWLQIEPPTFSFSFNTTFNKKNFRIIKLKDWELFEIHSNTSEIKLTDDNFITLADLNKQERKDIIYVLRKFLIDII